MYLRYAALGDSATFGIGDPVETGWRGWARLLAEALDTTYDVSFCNLAVPGATTTTVLSGQLDDALAHRPDLASLVVGINDTMRASWDPLRLREELMTCASALSDAGATLLTARFHDHGAVFGLPGVLRRPLLARIESVNRVYDEVVATYGGWRVDLAATPAVLVRRVARRLLLDGARGRPVDGKARPRPRSVGHADGLGGDPSAGCRDPWLTFGP